MTSGWPWPTSLTARRFVSCLPGSTPGWWRLGSVDPGLAKWSHPGIEHFTVGQRQGLGIATGERLHVVRIEPSTRRVVVGPRAAVPEQTLEAADATWLVPVPEKPFACEVQCRAQRAPAPAIVTPLSAGRFTACFTGGPEASPGPISPGQPAVIYVADRLVGGGWIER
jgi:tRNA-specific 2-thiouridylase